MTNNVVVNTKTNEITSTLGRVQVKCDITCDVYEINAFPQITTNQMFHTMNLIRNLIKTDHQRNHFYHLLLSAPIIRFLQFD